MVRRKGRGPRRPEDDEGNHVGTAAPGCPVEQSSTASSPRDQPPFPLREFPRKRLCPSLNSAAFACYTKLGFLHRLRRSFPAAPSQEVVLRHFSASFSRLASG